MLNVARILSRLMVQFMQLFEIGIPFAKRESYYKFRPVL